MNSDFSCKFSVREHIENSDLEREKEGGSITCTVNDSIVSTSGITESVVPDSFDNDESRCTSINQHNLFPDTANGFEASFQLNNYGNQTLNLPGCVNAEEDSTVRRIAVRDHEISMHSQLQMAVNEEPQEGEIPYLNLQ